MLYELTLVAFTAGMSLGMMLKRPAQHLLNKNRATLLPGMDEFEDILSADGWSIVSDDVWPGAICNRALCLQLSPTRFGKTGRLSHKTDAGWTVLHESRMLGIALKKKRKEILINSINEKHIRYLTNG